MLIHEALNHYICRYHMNKSSLARAVNLNPGTFSQILKGERELKADEFNDICNEMGTSCDKLIEYGKELEAQEE